MSALIDFSELFATINSVHMLRSRHDAAEARPSCRGDVRDNNMRILVVEDEKNMNRLISEAMTDEKYSVDSCFDGAEALDYAMAADYDVIILDVNLPKMDGFTVVERLREGGCASPVLFLTARDSVMDKVTGLNAGGDYYLTKPFSFDELRAVIKVMARKYTGNKTNEYTVGDLVVDTDVKDRDPRRRAGRPDGQGVRAARIHDKKQGRGALARDDREQSLELRLRGRHQCCRCVYRLPQAQDRQGP